jgi:hypothetical protein
MPTPSCKEAFAIRAERDELLAAVPANKMIYENIVAERDRLRAALERIRRRYTRAPRNKSDGT